LVISQVVLSFALPVPMIALVVLSSRRDVMGAMATPPAMLVLAIVATVATLCLNALLLADMLGLGGIG
jgi:manganese transport protein